jgi:hypothetical protein
MAVVQAAPPAPRVMQARTRVLLGALTFLAVAALAATIVVLLVDILDHNASLRDKEWFGHLASLAGILVISVLVVVIHRAAVGYQLRQPAPADAAPQAPGTVAVVAARGQEQIPGVLIGADNRLSTSKLAAFTWTWVLAWAILSLAVADWVGAPGGWTALVGQNLQDQYLILLGGPFVALVGAKALVSGGVQGGTLVKTEATDAQTPATRVSQAFSDDNGQTDLIDTQYLVFGALALVVFIVLFLRKSDAGLPDLPDVVVGLATLGATGYVANKFAARDTPPHLDRVVPDRAAPGATVTVFGRNTLSVTQGGKRATAADPIRVFLGALAVIAVDPADPGAHTTASGSDDFLVTLPDAATLGLQPGDHAVAVTVQNAVGVLADNTVPLTIVVA